jgi:dual specificity tyrosine-phosphorylation-regulated kinase 2/3/4
MNAKSLSPRIKPTLKKTKVVLRKLTSLKALLPKENDSINSVMSQESHNSFLNSQINSKLHSSSSKLNLKLSNPSPSFNITAQSKLKAMAEKCGQKDVKSFQGSPKLKGLQSLKGYQGFESFSATPTESLLPMNGLEVLATFVNHLSKFELREVAEYENVYYLGLKSRKIRPNENLKHKGFDDKDTDYMLVLGDHIAYQYEILEMLGSGSFSQVCKCLDHKTGKEVAIKIIKSHKRFEEQGQVELKVLSYLKKQEKSYPGLFVQMSENFLFRGHLCIVFELLSFNLYDLLKANCFKGFSPTLIRRFAVQVLKGLKFLSEHNIIHCDLKPENIILINGQESLVKIIDFGSACFEKEKIYFYIQSRIYRAPEIILGISYSCAIDMWSFGCIVSELLTGVPLFQGECESDQLFAIMEVLGCPPESTLKQATRKNKFFHSDGSAKNLPNSKGKIRVPCSKTLEEKLKNEDFIFLDFIKSKEYLECLTWSPEQRMTPEEALEHPWIREMKKMRIKGQKSPKSPRLKLT